MLSDSVTHGEGGCFLGETSLKSQLGGLTDAVIFFKAVSLFRITEISPCIIFSPDVSRQGHYLTLPVATLLFVSGTGLILPPEAH